MSKIRVHYVSGPVGEPNSQQVWGGTMATNYTIQKAFQNSDKYDLIIRPRDEFFTMEEVDLFLKAGDISWVDESSISNKYFLEGYDRPDVLGPISRSPVKSYSKGTWKADYTPEWFYGGKVLRLNEAEEKEETLLQEYKKECNKFVTRVNFIRHAVDTELLKPNFDLKKKYVLWAGSKPRPAKNYALFEEIMKEVDKLGGLPEGYEFKVMSGYTIEEYYGILDETVILVNTSLYESFCCAVAEAMAKGVPTLVRKDFNGKFMFKDRPIQVDYDAKSYATKILYILKKDKVLDLSLDSRKYAEDNFSFDCMRMDIEKVFDEVLEEKNAKH